MRRFLFVFVFIFLAAAIANADSLAFRQVERGACGGDNLFFQVTIENEGSSLKHYSLSLEGLDGRSFTKFSPNEIDVAAQSIAEFELWATASTDAIPSDYVFILSAYDVYGNLMQDQAMVSLDLCEYADAQIIPPRPAVCIGDVTPITVELHNSGKKPIVALLDASLPLQFSLSQNQFVLQPDDYAQPVLFVTVPKNFSPRALPFSIKVSTAGGRSREISSVMYADYCPNLKLFVPDKISLRADEKLDVPATIQNAGKNDDIAVLSLDCAPFASLSPSEFSLSAGATGVSMLHLSPLYSDGGKTFDCSVVARSQRYGLSYTAKTLITIRYVPGKEISNDTNVKPDDFVQPAADAEIILDSSESMGDYVRGMRKIDVAKDFTSYFLDHVSTMRVGLRVYGAQYRTTDANACKDSLQLSPIKANNAVDVKSKADSLQPSGMTPIALALTDAVKDFERRNDNLIVLVSDGVESCGQDPCAVAEQLRAKNIRVYAIGFDINEAGRQQLKCIADQTGGRYYDAGSYGELLGVIDQIFMRKQVGDNLSISFGEPVFVSQNSENATLQVNVSVFNYGDYTGGQATLQGLPEGANYSFEPSSFSIVRNQNMTLVLTATVPKKEDSYNATLVITASHGTFSKQITLGSRVPFSFTGFFTAAGPALMILGIVIIVALGIFFLISYVKKREEAAEKGQKQPVAPHSTPMRLGRIRDMISFSHQRPLPIDKAKPDDEELALFLSKPSA